MAVSRLISSSVAVRKRSIVFVVTTFNNIQYDVNEQLTVSSDKDDIATSNKSNLFSHVKITEYDIYPKLISQSDCVYFVTS